MKSRGNGCPAASFAMALEKPDEAYIFFTWLQKLGV
jgi:hypothetical protein